MFQCMRGHGLGGAIPQVNLVHKTRLMHENIRPRQSDSACSMGKTQLTHIRLDKGFMLTRSICKVIAIDSKSGHQLMHAMCCATGLSNYHIIKIATLLMPFHLTHQRNTTFLPCQLSHHHTTPVPVKVYNKLAPLVNRSLLNTRKGKCQINTRACHVSTTRFSCHVITMMYMPCHHK